MATYDYFLDKYVEEVDMVEEDVKMDDLMEEEVDVDIDFEEYEREYEARLEAERMAEQEQEYEPEFDSDFEPEFLSDEEDEFESDLTDEEPTPRVNFNRVFEIKPATEKNETLEKAFEGKLNWIDIVPTDQLSVQNAPVDYEVNFPVYSEEMPREKSGFKIVKKWKKPKRSPIRVVVSNQTKINMMKAPIEKINRPCKYILEDQTCPFGGECRFKHEKPMCKFMVEGNLCQYKGKCKFFHPEICTKKSCKCPKFHPKPQALALQKNLKTRFCIKIIQTGECPFKNDCKYAHTIDEVAANVEPCKFGPKCNLVEKVRAPANVVQRRSITYKNVEGEKRKCNKLHPKETIQNFIARMQ
jgi:hypothetical protein